jgi:DNA/RNA-binding domain of Phe-tRNA-synthetase-like protein
VNAEARIDVAPDVQEIVRPGVLALDEVTVAERAEELDAALIAAAARARTALESPEITAAVRAMYHRIGIDPTRTRPSSEALLRRVRKGGELPRINSLVDVVNWCSLETGLPYGLYDLDRIRGGVGLRRGRDGEEYAGIRKDVVHVAGRLTLADDDGPFGNPTSDSARTMVTVATSRALVVVFTPAGLPASLTERALALTGERVGRFCKG